MFFLTKLKTYISMLSRLPSDYTDSLTKIVTFERGSVKYFIMSEFAMASQSIEELLTSYHELNPDFVDELTNAPSPLEFMRYVATNRPFIVRGGVSHWPACSKWDVNYLKRTMCVLFGVTSLYSGFDFAISTGARHQSR